MPTIPERQPIGDTLDGMLLRLDATHILALAPLPDADVVASGTLTLRYAIRYLGKPHLSIVPGLLALDYGDILTGEEAWSFLLRRSNLHPRADVVGYRNDGQDDMIPVKWLDLAQPIDVLAYADASTTTPIARVDALIAPHDAVIAPRIREYLPCFPTPEDWQANRSYDQR